jgi:hypothetical protein
MQVRRTKRSISDYEGVKLRNDTNQTTKKQNSGVFQLRRRSNLVGNPNLADYQDEFETVEAKFAKNLSQGLTIRLDPATLAKVRSLAKKKGIGPTTLIRMWILDDLEQLEHQAHL